MGITGGMEKLFQYILRGITTDETRQGLAGSVALEKCPTEKSGPSCLGLGSTRSGWSLRCACFNETRTLFLRLKPSIDCRQSLLRGARQCAVSKRRFTSLQLKSGNADRRHWRAKGVWQKVGVRKEPRDDIPAAHKST